MKLERPLAIALLLACAGAALHLLILPADSRERSDLPLYLDSSLRWATGERPYAEIPFEYPPAALLFLRAPLHAAAAVQGRYETAFALWMALFDAVALFAAWLSTRKLWCMGVTWAGLALCASVLHTRFDVAPGALMALALALPWTWAGAALGAAAALKLYPLAIAPALAVAAYKQGMLRKALLAGALTALLLSLPAALDGGAATLEFFRYHWSRGVQMQSLWAGALMTFARGPVEIAHRFGAEELTQAPRFIGPLSLLLQLACGLGAAWAVHKGASLKACALAAFAGFVAFGKVGSPQFLLALVPLAGCAAADEPFAAGAVLVSCGLMAWEFPRHFGALFHNQGPWSSLVLLRQTLVALVAVLLPINHRAHRDPL